MPKRSEKKLKHIILLSLLLLFLAVAIGCFFLLSVPQERRKDYKRIASEEYDTVFLSMFPIDHYNEEDYSYYRAQQTLKTSYSIPDADTLQTYMKKIAASGNMISTIYLGVRPDHITGEELLQLTQKYPSVSFHIILAYPSMNYWTELSDLLWEANLSQYRALSDTLLYESNVSIYLFSQEWLISNPANYETDFLTTEDISHTLMLFCDGDHGYVITPDNIDSMFAEFYQMVANSRTAPTVYPDLSDYTIVFFGDSIIANYTNSTSIPGVVNGLTGACVYNCGYGGHSASFNPAFSVTFPDIADAFINRDPSALPVDSQVYRGITEYIRDTQSAKKLCFVINYGLNDYFVGAPVSTEDPYDTTSYAGALRTAVASLQEAYPEAEILLMSPNFTSYFSNGEERNSEVGGILSDYVNAVTAIGDEYGVTVLDNYTELNINANNHGTYLVDGCHPNERTRFTIGSRIAQILK